MEIQTQRGLRPRGPRLGLGPCQFHHEFHGQFSLSPFLSISLSQCSMHKYGVVTGNYPIVPGERLSDWFSNAEYPAVRAPIIEL